MNNNQHPSDNEALNEMDFRAGTIHLLMDIGVSAETSQLIVENYFKQSCQEFSGAKSKQCFRKIILNFLIECILQFKTYEAEIPLLINYLVAKENKLNQFEYGKLLHMKAVKAWKNDNDILFALHYLNKSLDVFAKLKALPARGYLPRVYDTYGQLLTSRGSLIDAREEFMKALEGRKILNDQEGKAITLGNLGRLSMQIGDFDNAIRYFGEDYDIVNKYDGDNASIRGQLLSTICICYLELGDLSKARDFNEESYQINQKSNNKIGLIFNKLNLAQIAIKEKNIDLAESLINELSTEIQQTCIYSFVKEYIKAKIFHLKASVLFQRKNIAESMKFFEKALGIYTRELSISPVETAQLLHEYAKLAVEFGDATLAGKLYRQSLRYLDTTEEQRSRAMIEEEMKASFKDSWILHSAGRFLGHEQINFLLEEAGKGHYAGEEKEAVVLFTDIRGFTSLTEKLPPEQLITILNGFLGVMTRAIETYGGFVDKFIGDSIMAVFSLPEPRIKGPGNDSESAVLASLLMIEELKRFNRNLPKDIPGFKIGIGLHSGLITSGLIGSPQKRSYTVIGDVANTASRLEGMTKMLGAEILVSSSVCERFSRKDFIVRPLGRFCPKGRVNYVDVFDIMGLDDGSPLLQKFRDECISSEIALQNFYQRDFKKAERAYQELIIKHPDSNRIKAYEIMLKAIASRINSPPDEKWNGEIILDQK